MLDSNLKIEAIFFDLDDTLLDSKKAQEKSINEFKKMFKEFNNIGEKEFYTIWHNITEACYEEFLYNKNISFEEMRMNRMKKLFLQFGIKLNDEQAKEYFSIYLKSYEGNWVLFDDTIEVLDRLSDKYKLGVISNGNGKQQIKKLEKTNIKKYFSQVIASEETGFAKPDKKIFEIACEKLNVKPENALMIGDKYKVDVIGGINSGLNAIWFNNRKEENDYKYQINKLSEILNYID